MTQGAIVPQPPSAKWDDLPPEIVEQILVHVDDSTLFALVKVNRRLNYMALAQLLGPQIMKSVCSSSCLVLKKIQPKESIPALCASLWTPHISHIRYFPFHDSLRNFINDLFGLCDLMNRMTSRSLNTLELGFLVYDREEMGKCMTDRRPTLGPTDWVRLLTQVVDLALSKGCERLELDGGTLYPYLMVNQAQKRTSLLSPIKRISRVFQVPTGQSLPSPSRLRDLTIAVCDFLAPPLLDYTISMLNGASQTIQRLEFRFVWPINPEYLAWTHLLSSTHLINLTTLILTGDDFSLNPHTLLSFLSRHDAINHLKLDFASSIPTSTTSMPLSLGSPFLPNLKTLEAWPQLAVWLFRCSLHSVPNARWIASLGSVYILPTRTMRAVTGSTVDKAILSFNLLIPPTRPGDPDVHKSSPTATTQPRLILYMNFRAEFWVDWIRKHVDLTRTSAPSVLRLSRVTDLTLMLDATASPSSDLSEVTVIARWLWLFPRLQGLEIDGEFLPFSKKALNKQLYREILRRCLRLRRFRFFGELVLNL